MHINPPSFVESVNLVLQMKVPINVHGVNYRVARYYRYTGVPRSLCVSEVLYLVRGLEDPN